MGKEILNETDRHNPEPIIKKLGEADAWQP